MLRSRVDWNDDRPTVEVGVDWRWTRVKGGRRDADSVARTVSVLSPTESVVLEANALEWEDRRARFLRCAGRALVESPLIVQGRTRVSAFADLGAVEFVPSTECRVPTALAAAGLTGCAPPRRTIRVEWNDGVHRVCAWGRGGSWLPTPARTAGAEIWSVRPDGEVCSNRAPLALPRLDPRVWLAIGAAKARRRAGTFPARDPARWRPRIIDLVAASALASSLVFSMALDHHLEVASEGLEDAQRRFESERLRIERQRFEPGRFEQAQFEPAQFPRSGPVREASRSEGLR